MSKSNTAPAQDANAVHKVINDIGSCDFNTGMYAHTTGDGERTWVCYAQHHARRYFTITDANTDNPLIHVLSKDQSLMTQGIDDVDPTDVEYTLTLVELTADSFGSVHRLLGLDHVQKTDKRLRQKADVVKMSQSAK